MSDPATANVTALLTNLGFDRNSLKKAGDTDELVIDTFDGWQNPQISTNSPVRGCLCSRDVVPSALAA